MLLVYFFERFSECAEWVVGGLYNAELQQIQKRGSSLSAVETRAEASNASGANFLPLPRPS
jgi:hypothetical protein